MGWGWDPLRLAEDSVRADAAPDYVRLAGVQLLAVLKGRAPVGSPGHLPNAGISLHPLYAQGRLKAPTPQARDERIKGFVPRRRLLHAQTLEITKEPRPRLIGRH